MLPTAGLSFGDADGKSCSDGGKLGAPWPVVQGAGVARLAAWPGSSLWDAPGETAERSMRPIRDFSPVPEVLFV